MSKAELNPEKLRAAREVATGFAQRHVLELAHELLEWQDTALLKSGGRMRQLAEILQELDRAQSLKLAENFTVRAALEYCNDARDL